MNGKLFVVGTPIGNLGDMTFRAVETLKSVDFIAAEDTRVTRKLLTKLEISKPLFSYYEHNREESGERIISRLLSGESCALVTDAGMPAVSDPGSELVKLCAEANIETCVVPGASAVVAAVALSGLQSARFCFEGFLSTSKRARRAHLDMLRGEQRAMVFYEAPHKLTRTLADMAECFGGERQVAVCRELTKLHEEVLRTTLSGAVEHFAVTPPRGEFVLVIAGAEDFPNSAADMTEGERLAAAVALAARYCAEGEKKSDAARRAAAETGLPKSEIYKNLL